jgi:heme-degrading monooxygenase HmoA
MFIAVNKIAVPAAHREQMVAAFEKEAPNMKQFKGFLGLELWNAEDGSLLAVSRWESKEALSEYTSNPLFQAHHGGASNEQARQNPSANVQHYEARVLS